MKIASLLLTTALTYTGVVSADTTYYGAHTYEVTITNITPGQTFTPILAVTHKASFRVFELGNPASPELAALAESGDVTPLSDLLDGVPRQVLDQAAGTGLLGPGESVILTIRGNRRFNHLSLAAMLI
ncbi:MAG: spondin domain-containing protein, partial [Sedimenticolaceae bacterium]